MVLDALRHLGAHNLERRRGVAVNARRVELGGVSLIPLKFVVEGGVARGDVRPDGGDEAAVVPLHLLGGVVRRPD